MDKMKKLFLSLILILLVSGCANFPLDIPFISSQGPKVKEMSHDVISIENITVLPSNNVRESDEFSIYFEVTNKDEFNEIESNYTIYDTGLCNFTGGIPSNDRGSLSLSPKETMLVEWNFRAPSAEDIAFLSVVCPIRFKFNFSYTAKSQVDVLVVDSEHFMEMQRAGKGISFQPTINVGRGPIKIYFDFGTSLPVKNNSYLPVYIKVEDKGNGMLRKIKNNTFEINFPDNFNVEKNSCPFFSCEDNICTNNEDIPMINRKSLEIKCRNIKTPGSINEEETHFISAKIDYEYSAVGEVDIKVQP